MKRPDCSQNWIVDLTGEDLMVACAKACARLLVAIKKDRLKDHGSGDALRPIGTRLSDSVVGELGEIAGGRALGLASTARFGDFAAADLADKVEVRATDRDDGCLLTHPYDDDAAPFVLVVLRWGMRAHLAGWAYGRFAKQQKFWRATKRGAFYCPQSELTPMDTLIDCIRNPDETPISPVQQRLAGI